jgi:uncharacterized protein (DUF2147 family)
MNKLLSISVLLSIFTYLPIFAADNRVSGYWKTIDDETKKPRSIVEIFEKDAKIFGKIVKIFPHEGNKDLCEKCPDEFKNQPILGLKFMWDLKSTNQDSTKYDGGKILDPANGSIYRSKLELIENGQKLEVRGYIGISLFGRSQTWLRVKSIED